jgi:hypothetical protein
MAEPIPEGREGPPELCCRNGVLNALRKRTNYFPVSPAGFIVSFYIDFDKEADVAT